MAENTKLAGDLLPHPKENQDAKTKEWDETQKERGWRVFGSWEVDRDDTQQKEERTAPLQAVLKERK
jgi:hypothetical protein